MSTPGVLPELHPRITRRRSKLSTIALCALSTGALGTSAAVAVAASPACGEFVRTYVDRVERNLVSPTTLRHWREWGVKHPNWHPGLHVAKRPKFRTVREEKLSHMQVDCQVLKPEVPLLNASLDTFLVPPSTPGFEQALDAPVIAPLQAFQTPIGGTSIASIGSPSGGGGGFGGGIGGGGGGAAPGGSPTGGTPVSTVPISTTPISEPVPITPIAPVTPAPVPEPTSIVLTLTGMAAIAAFSIFRRKQPEYRHSS